MFALWGKTFFQHNLNTLYVVNNFGPDPITAEDSKHARTTGGNGSTEEPATVSRSYA